MFYIIEKLTGRKFRYYSKSRRVHVDYFNSQAAATRVMNANSLHKTHDVVPAEFYQPVMVERTNLLSGKPYIEDINTPICCSPASETYWSA